jgi:fructose-1,6-bisphosphatase/inositol monophosphatase family enzyme
VDTTVERHVREVIGAALPGHLVVGEEEGGSAQPGVPTWYLDPVDGTTNLASNIPWTSMSLALAVDRQPQVAVVCNPWTGDILAAAAGRGATRNGMPLRLDGAASLRVILTELRAHEPWSGQVVMLIRAAERHVTTRVMGSGTLTLAGIAAGWGQAAVIHAFSAVDHLAALLLVREAGGVVRDAVGRDVVFPDPGTPILAAHPAVADEAYAIWRGRD